MFFFGPAGFVYVTKSEIAKQSKISKLVHG